MTALFAGFAGCLEEYEDYDRSYSSSYSSSGHLSSQDDAEEPCELPSDRDEAEVQAPKDPLHIKESRDVHGYGSRRWDWLVDTCQVIYYNVTFAMHGTVLDELDAVALTFNIALEDPEGRTIVEERDTAVFSESRTVLNWTLKPGAPVKPGDWTLRYNAAGDYGYDVEIYLEY